MLKKKKLFCFTAFVCCELFSKVISGSRHVDFLFLYYSFINHVSGVLRGGGS